MDVKAYRIKLPQELVDNLRLLSLKAGYERGKALSWHQLLREGATLVIEKYGSPTETQREVPW